MMKTKMKLDRFERGCFTALILLWSVVAVLLIVAFAKVLIAAPAVTLLATLGISVFTWIAWNLAGKINW